MPAEWLQTFRRTGHRHPGVAVGSHRACVRGAGAPNLEGVSSLARQRAAHWAGQWLRGSERAGPVRQLREPAGQPDEPSRQGLASRLGAVSQGAATRGSC